MTCHEVHAMKLVHMVHLTGYSAAASVTLETDE